MPALGAERARKRRRGLGPRFPGPREALARAAAALAPAAAAAGGPRPPAARGQLAGGLVWLAVGEAAYGALYLACLGRPAPLQWDAPPDARGVRLAPEEAFLLAHELGCLEVVPEGSDCPLAPPALWAALRAAAPGFSEAYAAFRHFLAKGWFVRSGLSYGVDYVLYRGHPETAHAEFAAVVQRAPLLAAGTGRAVSGAGWGSPGAGVFADWVQVQALVRLCGQVAKQIVVFHARVEGRGGGQGGGKGRGEDGEESGAGERGGGDDWASLESLDRVEVRELVIGRWAPEGGKAPEAPPPG